VNTYFFNVDKLEHGKTDFMCLLIFKWLCYGVGGKYVRLIERRKKQGKA
jgi:hypothetical protein